MTTLPEGSSARPQNDVRNWLRDHEHHRFKDVKTPFDWRDVLPPPAAARLKQWDEAMVAHHALLHPVIVGKPKANNISVAIPVYNTKWCIRQVNRTLEALGG